MTSNVQGDSVQFAVLCVDDDADVLENLARDLERICAGRLAVERCSSAHEAMDTAELLNREKVRIPVIIADHAMPGTSGADLLITLHARPEFSPTRKVLLSGQTTLGDVSRALNAGALHRNLAKPWTFDALRKCVCDLFTEYLVQYSPESVDDFPELVDVTTLSQAFVSAERDRRVLRRQMKALRESFVTALRMSDAETERAVIDGLDAALNCPPRRQYPAGAVIIEEGAQVDEIAVLLAGQIKLTRRVGAREVIFHSASAGRIIGLMSLAHAGRAFFTCRAVTEVTVLPITMAQLDDALSSDPVLSFHFVTMLLRSMANRNRRIAELQIAVERLNDELKQERDQLTDALRRLEQAQMRLVESEKLATLGQLSAGVAHELNNPIAAIKRAADFVGEDVAALVEQLPDGPALRDVLLRALHSKPLSTREQRELRARLTDAVGSEALARQLIRVGITDPEVYRARFGTLSPRKRDDLLEKMERYHQLGTALRNLQSCGERVTAIVKSLRSYARPDQAGAVAVDLHEGIEDTLLLFQHQMRQVSLELFYGDLPPVECHPGEINQVWTNLVANALQAMNHRGTLRIETRSLDGDRVEVRITDSGPGIPPEKLQEVFEINYTTKQGHASFGLGLGLAICKQIVTRHSGTIRFESQPGSTTAVVVLPVRYTPMPGEEATPCQTS